MKSHDYHIMMQEILLVYMRHLMEKGHRIAIICLCHVFKKLCNKIVDLATMGEFKKKSGNDFSVVGKGIPTFFFNMMTHLLGHLVEDLFICGPIHTRWLYPIERYLKMLKGFVWHKARLEGSMAMGYALEEALRFCTEYLQNFTPTTQKFWDEKEDPSMIDEVNGPKHEIIYTTCGVAWW